MEHAELKVEVKALPVRSYLESNVVPILTQGLVALTIQRPPEPVRYLAKFMLNKGPPRPDPLSGVKQEVKRLVPRPMADPADAINTFHKSTATAEIPIPLLLPQTSEELPPPP